MEYNSLIEIINANIKANGRQAITGDVMNAILNRMVAAFGAGYQYMGMATPNLNPGSPDFKAFWLATEGTYTHMGRIEVGKELAVIKWDTAWSKEGTGVVTTARLTEILSGYVTTETLTEALRNKQDTLISGENIKTINGQSVLGEGDIVIQSGSADAVKYTEQELAEAQQEQARTNIAAASESEVSQLRSEVTAITKNLESVQGTNLFNKDSITSGYRLNGTSTPTADQNYDITDYIAVSPGSTIYLYYQTGGAVYNMSFYNLEAYNSNKENILSQLIVGAAHSYTIPDSCAFVRMSFNKSSTQTAMVTLDSTTPGTYIAYIPPYYKATQEFLSGLGLLSGVVTKEKTDFWAFQKSANLFNPKDITTGKYINPGNGQLYDSTNMFYCYIELVGAGDYSFIAARSHYGSSNAKKLALYDKDKNYIKNIAGVYLEEETVSQIKTKITVSQTDIDNGACYWGYSNNISEKDSAMFVYASTYPAQYVAFFEQWVLPDISIKNPLTGKIAVFDGDSICQGSNSAMGDCGNGWAGRISVYDNMITYNTGQGGATITAGTTMGSSNRHWVCRYIDTIYAQHPDADYIILEGGTNDADLFANLPEKIGTFSANDFTGPFDDETYYGALDSLFKKTLEYYPKSKIGFIIAQKMGVGTSANRRLFFDYAKAVCKKWSIPVLDLWDEGQLRPDVISNYNPEYNTIQTATEHGLLYYDGQHLTAYGYDVLSPKIAAWMKTL